jgi:hypothetical protein
MNLETCKAEEAPDDVTAFQIISSSKSFTVLAASTNDMKAWVTAINEAASNWRQKKASFRTRKATTTESVPGESRSAPLWVKDSQYATCMLCNVDFTVFRRRYLYLVLHRLLNSLDIIVEVVVYWYVVLAQIIKYYYQIWEVSK